MGPVSLNVLGPLQVRRGDDIVVIRSGRQRTLLLRLVIEGGLVSTDALIESLWGESPPEAARSTLKSHAARLRSVLGVAGNAIVGHRGGYELVLDRAYLDAARFERLVADARDRPAAEAVERLGQALALWRGPAFAEVRDEGFASAEVARLEELRLQAIELEAAAKLALGRSDEVVVALEALVEEHPLREQLWAHLMLALYRSGRQADSLRAYGTLRGALRDDLGVDPSPQLKQLEQAILEQRPELEGGPRRVSRGSRLPAPVGELIGRDADRSGVARALERHRLVVLTGTGGIGKTRLAIAAARQAAPDGPGAVAFADLTPISDPAAVAPTVAAAADAPPADRNGDVVDGLCDWLSSRRALLVLDNCEHVLRAAAEVVERVLEQCPEVTVLATSREPLGVVGEVEWLVQPLAVHDGPDDAGVAPAVRLFVERARSVRPSFRLDPVNGAAVEEICEALDGLPLAIELAAARIAHLAPAQIAARLGDRLHFLRDGARRLERHRTLEATIAWSVDLLDDAERRLFARLAVFAGEFSLEAVEGICADTDTERAGALDTLGRLVRKSLVVASDHGDVARYRLLDTLRHVAAQGLDRTGEAGVRRMRHRDWYVAWTEALPSEQSGLSTAAAATFRRERGNIRLAMEAAAADERPDLVARLLAATGALWRQGGGSEFDECGRWLEVALADETGLDPDVRVGCHAIAAFRARMMTDDDAPAAEIGHGRAAINTPDAAVTGPLACAWSGVGHRLAVAAASSGDEAIAVDAVAHVDRAVALLDDLPRPWRVPVLWDRGMVFLNLGRLADAREAFAQALDDFGAIDEEYRAEETMVRACLALVLHLCGEDQAAMQVSASALARLDAAGDADGWLTVQPRAFLAVALAAGGDVEKGRRVAQASITAAARISTRLNAADFLIALGAIATMESRWERAGVLLGSARRMGLSYPNPFRTPMGFALYRHYNARVREALDPETSRRARQEGMRMGFDEAVAFALSDTADPWADSTSSNGPHEVVTDGESAPAGR